MRNKRVIRPYIGIKMTNFIQDRNSNGNIRKYNKSSDLISASDLKVMVVEVERNSPASKSGIQR